jgi:hypothetical protein
VLRILRLLFAMPLLALLAAPAHADPGYYVVTAYDNADQRSIDFRYWTVQNTGRREWIWPEVGFAYGVNSRWTTELFMSYIGPSNWDIVPSTLNWQNDVLLTQGEWPIDVAVHTQLVREVATDGKRYYLEYGPALQTDIGRTQLNANLFFERTFDYQAPPIELKYQWQVRHRWQPWLNFGAQGFGELGRWDHWNEGGKQSHRAGPAVFGHLDLGQSGERNALLYQAAYLLGTIYNARGHMFTMRLQYAF